ncbi:hypothetical protein BsWGS_20910 [Bradybaena similaris]
MTTALVVVLACAVVALSSACCTPDQWEGVQTAFGGYASTIRPSSGIISMDSAISYDAKNNRSASFITGSGRGEEFKLKLLTIYDNKSGAGKLYVMDYIKDVCNTVILRTPFRRSCVPAEAKPVVNFSLGYAPAIKAVGYQIPGKEVQTFLSVQDLGNNQCVPVSEALYGTVRQVNIVETVAFINITSGIKNETVFDIPEKCQKMTDSNLAERLLHEYYIMAI